MDEARLIKERTDLKSVMESYGVIFGRSGYAVCPFHNEKTGSLSVKGGRFKCFGCGAGGDVIDFTMKYFGIDFRQALLKLDTDFSLHVFTDAPMTHKARKEAREREMIRRNFYAWKRSRKMATEKRIDVLCSVMRKLERMMLTYDNEKLKELRSSIALELDELEKEIQWITN